MSASISINCMCVLKLFSHVQLFVTYGPRSLPSSSVHGILQVGILEWVAMPSSRGSSLPRDPTQLMFPALAGSFLTTIATWEAHLYLYSKAVFLYDEYKFHKASHEILNLVMGFLFAHQMESLFLFNS